MPHVGSHAGTHAGAAPRTGPRDALLSAAGRLLRDDGPEALTLARVAREADVAPSTAARRLGGRDGLLLALYERGYAALEAALREALPAPGSGSAPLDDVLAVARAYRAFAFASPGRYRLMLDPGRAGLRVPEEARAASWRCLQPIQVAAARATDAGVADHDDVDALALMLWTASHGLVSAALGGSLRRLEVAALHDGLVRRALTRGPLPGGGAPKRPWQL